MAEHKLYGLYGDLFDECQRKNDRHEFEYRRKTALCEYSMMTMLKGKEYLNSNFRMLIVGRAVNGSDEVFPMTRSDAEQQAKNNFEKGLDWFQWDNRINGLSNLKNLDDKDFYRINQSAFWRTTYAIWSALNPNQEELNDKEWIKYIAWSNLYKVAPKNSGNPSTTLQKAQKDICRKILNEEISIIKPTHILYATGLDWLEDFWGENLTEFSKMEHIKRYGLKKEAIVSFFEKDGIQNLAIYRPDRTRKVDERTDSIESLYVQDALTYFH